MVMRQLFPFKDQHTYDALTGKRKKANDSWVFLVIMIIWQKSTYGVKGCEWWWWCGFWWMGEDDQAVMIVAYVRYGREESNMVGLAAENSLTCADWIFQHWQSNDVIWCGWGWRLAAAIMVTYVTMTKKDPIWCWRRSVLQKKTDDDGFTVKPLTEASNLIVKLTPSTWEY